MSGVSYHEKEGLPGLQFFACPAGMGTISKVFCAENYTKANTKEFITERKRLACRFCPIGALHAGLAGTDSGSRLFGSFICTRCERYSSRLVLKKLCPSCYNRQGENQRGLNARGSPLRKKRNYRDIRLWIIKADKSEVSTSMQVMSLSEALLSRLTETNENMKFAWAGSAII